MAGLDGADDLKEDKTSGLVPELQDDKLGDDKLGDDKSDDAKLDDNKAYKPEKLIQVSTDTKTDTKTFQEIVADITTVNTPEKDSDLLPLQSLLDNNIRALYVEGIEGSTEDTEDSIKALRNLIRRGACLNTRSKVEYRGAEITALHEAVRLGLFELARVLIDEGADIIFLADRISDIRSPMVENSTTILHEATDPIKHIKNSDFFSESETAEFIKFVAGAVCSRNQKLFEDKNHYIQAKASQKKLWTDFLDVRGRFGDTALHNAVAAGHKEVAAALVQAGANVNAENSINGQTPLHYSVVKYGREFTGTMGAFLVENCGADALVEDYMGQTPAAYAEG